MGRRKGGKKGESSDQLKEEQHEQPQHKPTQGTEPETSSSVPPEEGVQEFLTLLPEGVLDDMMSLLAAGEGGSCIRATCHWLRSIFDRHNTRLVLRGADEQLPDSFPARLLDLARHSPCVSSLTLAEDLECVTWPQVLEAGGPQLLHRLEQLSLMCRPPVLDFECLAACTKLQHLCQLQHVAACGSASPHLELQDYRAVWDFAPLAACSALQRLALRSCKLKDLAPLAACVRLQQLRLSGSDYLEDLSPLTACEQLQTLHVTYCSALEDLGPLAACVGLQVLKLARCTGLQDLSPLAACIELQQLDLEECRKVADLRPLAACVGLQTLVLKGCKKVKSLSPLISCQVLESLDLRGCKGVPGIKSLSALPRLRIIK